MGGEGGGLTGSNQMNFIGGHDRNSFIQHFTVHLCHFNDHIRAATISQLMSNYWTNSLVPSLLLLN